MNETHATFLDLDIKIEDEIFGYKFFDKRNNFHFSLPACHTLKAIFPQPYPMVIFFRISLYSQMFTETFSTKSFRTLFKDAIARGKSKLHQKTDPEKFSKISRRTQKYSKNYNKLL